MTITRESFGGQRSLGLRLMILPVSALFIFLGMSQLTGWLAVEGLRPPRAEPWVATATSLVELAGGVLLLTSGSAFYAAIALGLVSVATSMAFLRQGDVVFGTAPLLLLVPLTVVAYLHWPRLIALKRWMRALDAYAEREIEAERRRVAGERWRALERRGKPARVRTLNRQPTAVSPD
jgi:hypothetical protein